LFGDGAGWLDPRMKPAYDDRVAPESEKNEQHLENVVAMA
jgi:hypothetical protein